MDERKGKKERKEEKKLVRTLSIQYSKYLSAQLILTIVGVIVAIGISGASML